MNKKKELYLMCLIQFSIFWHFSIYTDFNYWFVFFKQLCLSINLAPWCKEKFNANFSLQIVNFYYLYITIRYCGMYFYFSNRKPSFYIQSVIFQFKNLNWSNPAHGTRHALYWTQWVFILNTTALDYNENPNHNDNGLNSSKVIS